MYEAKDFSSLLGTTGFSDELLNNHFQLYNGYVKNTNNALDLMKKHEAGSYEFGEIRRRFGWEFSGMRLHELYFGNMTKDGGQMDLSPELAKRIEDAYGSTDAWMEDFIKTGGMRGIGWVITYYDEIGDRVMNTWINEHDMGNIPGQKPLLAMDMWEHAFMVDYGLKKADYIKSFTNAIDWQEVEKRFKD